MEQFSQEDIEQRVYLAIKRLELHDAYLLENDCNERSITHRLAMYLQSEFEGWDVDCEYNRDHRSLDLIKRLPSKSTRTDDEHANTVFPDIIVHNRGTSDNLLVIEVKKSTNGIPDEEDIEKLEKFKGLLGYHYALFLRFNVKDDFQRNRKLLKRMEWVNVGEGH